ncbi:MAG: DUF6798 domain-containing protein [Pirellulaceae bacterium]|nr:DUF6798 domain-containing protein [Pirellulaceae bacterium]
MHIHASQEKEGLDKKNLKKFSIFLPKASRIGSKNADCADFGKEWGLLAFETLLVTCIFSLYAGVMSPDVNESHYLVKAQHFWNPAFAERDLFLASSDAHWFFFATVGALTQWMNLPVAAWIGRTLGWLALAMGWCLFIRRLSGFRLAAATTAPLWIACMHFGHLSGEWVVGGCEAKVFSYALAFIGLSEIAINRWSKAWIWFGAASAFHVLTGGWITLATIISYWIVRWRASLKSTVDNVDENLLIDTVEPIRKQWIGLFFGLCFSLPGLLPALMLGRGVAAATAEEGAMIYVFQRLPHHLSPLRFAASRWVSFGVLVAVSMLLAWGFRRCRGTKLASLFEITTVVSLIALVGVLIDVCLSNWATNWSASLLRFYWFRWNDVIWPTLLTVLAMKLSTIASNNESQIWRSMAILLLLVPGPLLLGIRYIENGRADLAPADQASLVTRSETKPTQRKIRNDWLDVCYWIHSNTPEDSLFLTPRSQQTFKWYAQRAEVACWKDAPQDAVGLIEWERRMLDIFPRSLEGYAIPMTGEHIMRMLTEYNIDYLIVDRRLQKQPPTIPLVHSNATYAIFHLSVMKP